MSVFKVTSNPTFRDMKGRFAKANTSLLNARRQEMKSLGRKHKDALKRFAPRDTGKFAAGIRFQTFQRGDSIGFTVSTPQPLGTWLRPPGTKPHTINPRRPGGMLRFTVNGVEVFARSVKHPGYKPPNDFVKEATESMQTERLRALRRMSTRYIEQVIK